MEVKKRPKDENHYILGFTNDYYTIWHYTLYWMPVSDSDGHWNSIGYRPSENTNYLQNLSIDYDEAVDKITEKCGDNWIEDLTQRGMYFSRRDSDLFADNCPDDVFKFGKYSGQLVVDVNDNKYKQWYWGAVSERPEACKFIENHLLDLGLLFKYKGEIMNDWQYAKAKAEAKKKKLKSGHHFIAGERVEVEVKYLEGFHFDGRFGTTYVETYQTKDGLLVKYKGSRPPDISDKKYVKVMATVKHDSYLRKASCQQELYDIESGKITPELSTMLQRIKVA